MNLFFKVKNKLIALFRRHIQRDPFLLEAARWFHDKGDETLRLDYPITQDSVVFDIGGYHGDFTAAIHERYGCIMYIFEPIPEFYKLCVKRFHGNDKIVCLNYGLSANNGSFDITLAENGSSFSNHIKGVSLQVKTRSIVQCIHELDIKVIDLMKINIEGGEFDVIPALIESNDILLVRYLQVQFHNFVDGAQERRAVIRAHLTQTHSMMWNYEFIWESWKLKAAAS